MSFAEKLAVGQLGESAIARWLTSRECVVLPAYDVEIDTGKGPRVQTWDGPIVSPDLAIVDRRGRFAWVEAKHKTVFSWRRCRPGPRWETGVDLHHWREYLRLSRMTAAPLWLLFLHRETGPVCAAAPGPSPVGLFAIKAEKAAQAVREDPVPRSHAPRGMAYWGRADLALWARLSEVPL